MNRFEGKHVIITGCAQGIGKAMAEAFRAEGAIIHGIDKQSGNHYVGDISSKEVLEQFAAQVLQQTTNVDVLINNALPLMRGLDVCTWDEFNYALAVGVSAPFYLAKLFAPHFAQGASIINIASTRAAMSQPQTESYSAAKGGISALTHALSVSLSGRVRVNSIAPGWIDTAYTVYEGPDASQQPAGRVGHPGDIAKLALFLASEDAGFITGENITVDGGMTKLMIYHNDCGWHYDG